MLISSPACVLVTSILLDQLPDRSNNVSLFIETIITLLYYILLKTPHSKKDGELCLSQDLLLEDNIVVTISDKDCDKMMVRCSPFRHQLLKVF